MNYVYVLSFRIICILVISFFILRFLDLIVLIFLVLIDEDSFFVGMLFSCVLIIGVGEEEMEGVDLGLDEGVSVGFEIFFGCCMLKWFFNLVNEVLFGDFWGML